MTRNLPILTAALCVVGAASLARAAHPVKSAHWPTFRGADRSGVSSDTGLLAEWPKGGPELVWEAKGAGRGYSSVAIADGKLYTQGDHLKTVDNDDTYLICYDLASGKELWKTRLGEAWDKGSKNWQGSRSTPTVDGERVYILTPHGDLFALATDDGKVAWRKNLKDDFGGKKGDGWGYSESVTIDGDKLVCTPGGEKNTMVALDKNTGDLIWSAVREGDRGAGHASIVISEIGGTRVYVNTTASGALGVRAKDGELLWSYPIDKTTAVIPSPIVKGDLVFFTAGYGRGGALLRQVPAGAGEVDVKEVFPLNPKLQNKHGGVILVGDYLYADSGDGGIPFCAELMTGDQQWKSRSAGKGSMSLTAAEGLLYLHFANGVMALARATPDGYEEISHFKIPGDHDRPSWAHPVITGGRLYLRDTGRVYCYDLRK